LHKNSFLPPEFVSIFMVVPRGRPPKGDQNRERLTLRLPPDLIAGIKRAAKRQKKSQADFVDAAVRAVLIAEGILRPPPK
jgi:hypothetical protein